MLSCEVTGLNPGLRVGPNCREKGQLYGLQEAIELRNRTGSAGGSEGSSGRSLSAAGTELSKAPGQLAVHTKKSWNRSWSPRCPLCGISGPS